jgi:hypothetical protein
MIILHEAEGYLLVHAHILSVERIHRFPQGRKVDIFGAINGATCPLVSGGVRTFPDVRIIIGSKVLGLTQRG